MDRQESAWVRAGFKRGFVTHYNEGYEAYEKMRDLATEFPNISQAIKLPEPTTGYQRKAQTMLGYTNATGTGPTATVGYVRFDANNLPVAGASPTTGAQQTGTVVLTSKSVRPPGRQQPHGPDQRPGRGREPTRR